jgi:hypothetical protein
MLFDPEDGKTMEEILDSILRRRPELKAELETISAVSGRSVYQLMLEGIALTLDTLKDPDTRTAWLATVSAKLDRREAPLGFDPLVRKDR